MKQWGHSLVPIARHRSLVEIQEPLKLQSHCRNISEMGPCLEGENPSRIFPAFHPAFFFDLAPHRPCFISEKWRMYSLWWQMGWASASLCQYVASRSSLCC